MAWKARSTLPFASGAVRDSAVGLEVSMKLSPHFQGSSWSLFEHQQHSRDTTQLSRLTSKKLRIRAIAPASQSVALFASPLRANPTGIPEHHVQNHLRPRPSCHPHDLQSFRPSREGRCAPVDGIGTTSERVYLKHTQYTHHKSDIRHELPPFCTHLGGEA